MSTPRVIGAPLTARIGRLTDGIWPEVGCRFYVAEWGQRAGPQCRSLVRMPSRKYGGSMVIRRRFRMWASRILLVIAWAVVASAASTGDIWTILAVDSREYGHHRSLADAVRLSWRFDRQQDVLWLRLALFARPVGDAFGVNIGVDFTHVRLTGRRIHRMLMAASIRAKPLQVPLRPEPTVRQRGAYSRIRIVQPLRRCVRAAGE